MNGPAVVSLSPIAPEAALRTWPRLIKTLADSGDAADELVCYISVFRDGGGVLEGIERVRGALATAMPAGFEGRVMVEAAPSTNPDADTPGTLYIDCLFRPGARKDLADEMYARGRWRSPFRPPRTADRPRGSCGGGTTRSPPA